MADAPRAPDDDDVVPVDLEKVREARGEKIVAVRRSKLAGLRAFRRIRADRILGVIGVIALAIALVLVFEWENPPEEEPAWPVEWEEDAFVPEGLNQTAGPFLYEPDPGGTSRPAGPAGPTENEHSFEITQTNATVVVVSVSWVDDVGNPEEGGIPAGDQMNITVYGPDGSDIQVAREDIANVTGPRWVNITVPLNPIPSIGSAPVETEAEARQFVADNTNETRYGTGTWRVVVRMVAAHDPGVAPGETCLPIQELAGQCQADPGNEYEITVGYATYRVTFPPPDAP